MFGQVVIALLIQIGGLGITSLGVGIIALAGKRTNFRERLLIKEALNYPSFKDVLKLIRWVLILTFSIEAAGAVLCLPLFLREYPLGKAVGISVFHAVAAFNNAGMDIFGRGTSMIPYAGDVALNLITTALIILGGIGFFVITEVARVRKWKKCSLQTKVVLSMTGILLVLGTVLLKLTEGAGITWLGVGRVIAKARSEEQGEVLTTLGAEVVYPEKDMAIRLAHRLTAPHILEYISLSPEIDIMEIALTDKVAGKTVLELDVRKRFGLNIIAVKQEGKLSTEILPTTVLSAVDSLTVIGKTEAIHRFENYLQS